MKEEEEKEKEEGEAEEEEEVFLRTRRRIHAPLDGWMNAKRCVHEKTQSHSAAGGLS